MTVTWPKVFRVNLSKFLQASPNVLLFKHAPIHFAMRYLRLLGRLYYIVNPRERGLIEKNIKDVFKDSEKTDEIVRQAFDGIFSHYSEKLLMAYRNFDMLQKEIGEKISYSGLDHIDKALEKGGVLLVTGHFGGVEFMPLALFQRNYPVSMVVEFQTKELKKSLMARAATRNVELIDGRGDNVMLEICTAIKRGRVVITECDEIDAWRTKANKTVDAFGGHILQDRTLDIMCRRCGSTVLSSWMVRTGNGYRLTIEPLQNLSENEGAPISITIIKNFEKFVMKFPDQWYQWKKFHKMRPEVA